MRKEYDFTKGMRGRYAERCNTKHPRAEFYCWLPKGHKDKYHTAGLEDWVIEEKIVRKTKRQRMQLDFTVEYDREMDSMPFHMKDGLIIEDYLVKALKAMYRTNKGPRPLILGPIRFNIALDFREAKPIKVKPEPPRKPKKPSKATPLKKNKSSKCDDYRCE